MYIYGYKFQRKLNLELTQCYNLRCIKLVLHQKMKGAKL